MRKETKDSGLKISDPFLREVIEGENICPRECGDSQPCIKIHCMRHAIHCKENLLELLEKEEEETIVELILELVDQRSTCTRDLREEDSPKKGVPEDWFEGLKSEFASRRQVETFVNKAIREILTKEMSCEDRRVQEEIREARESLKSGSLNPWQYPRRKGRK